MVGVRGEGTWNYLALSSRLRCQEQNGELGTRFVRGPSYTLPLPWHVPLLTVWLTLSGPPTTPLVLDARVGFMEVALLMGNASLTEIHTSHQRLSSKRAGSALTSRGASDKESVPADDPVPAHP